MIIIIKKKKKRNSWLKKMTALQPFTKKNRNQTSVTVWRC